VRASCGPLELPCRLGGDEFALVALGADTGDLANRAVQLVAAVRGLRLGSSSADIRLSVSVGACFFQPGEEWSATYSRADAALYQAKLAGGDTWKLGP
jgi:diguanylate cyclase